MVVVEEAVATTAEVDTEVILSSTLSAVRSSVVLKHPLVVKIAIVK